MKAFGNLSIVFFSKFKYLLGVKIFSEHIILFAYFFKFGCKIHKCFYTSGQIAKCSDQKSKVAEKHLTFENRYTEDYLNNNYRDAIIIVKK